MAHIQKEQESALGAKNYVIETINSIKLVNYMAFVGEHIIDFTDKNIIIGENGAGKTSIFEAILLSLGESGRNKAKLAKYINKKADSCSIVLDCTLTTGQSLMISTTISNEGKRQEKIVEIDGEKTENTAAINFLRSCNFDVFAQIAFLKQTTEGLIADSPSQTFKNIRGILKSDFWTEHEMVTNDIKEKKAEMSAINDRVNEINGSIKSLESIVSTAKKEIESNSTPLSVTESLESLEAQLKDITLKIGAAHERSFRIVAKEKHINEIKGEIRNLDEQLKDDKNSLLSLENQRLEVENKIANATLEDVAKLQEKFDNLQSLLMGATQKLSEIDANKRVASSKFNAIKSGKCPTCGSTFTAENIKQFETELNEICTKFNEANSEVQKLSSDRDHALSEARNASDAANKVNVAKATLEGIKKNIQSMQDAIKTIEDSKVTKVDLLAEKEKALEEYKSEGSDNETELNAQEKAINDKISAIRDFEAQKEKIESLKEQVLEHEKSIIKLEGDRAKLNKNIETCTKDLELYEEAKDVFATKLPAFFIKSMIETLEAGMTQIVKQFNYDYVKIELTEDADGLEFMLCQSEFEVYMSELSQFERTMMQFALKTVLAKLLGNRVICFDEPDYAACQSNELNIANFLKDLSNDMQLILISHSQTTKEVLYDAGAQIIEVIKEGTDYDDNNGSTEQSD